MSHLYFPVHCDFQLKKSEASQTLSCVTAGQCFPLSDNKTVICVLLWIGTADLSVAGNRDLNQEGRLSYENVGVCASSGCVVSDELDLLLRRSLCNASWNLLQTPVAFSKISSKALSMTLGRRDQITTRITCFNQAENYLKTATCTAVTVSPYMNTVQGSLTKIVFRLKVIHGDFYWQMGADRGSCSCYCMLRHHYR